MCAIFSLIIHFRSAKLSFLCLSDISGYQDTNHTSKHTRSSVLWEAIKIKEEISMQPYPAGFLLQQGHVRLLFEQSVVKVNITVWVFFFFSFFFLDLYSQACHILVMFWFFKWNHLKLDRMGGHFRGFHKNRAFSFRKHNILFLIH